MLPPLCDFESAKDGGFSVRGGAFSLLGPISKGSGDGSPDAVTEDDAALAAFDKTLEQQLLGLQLLTPAILGCADGRNCCNQETHCFPP